MYSNSEDYKVKSLDADPHGTELKDISKFVCMMITGTCFVVDKDTDDIKTKVLCILIDLQLHKIVPSQNFFK
jgi:hypothetical protein